MSQNQEKAKPTASNEIAKAIANYKDFRHKEHKFLMLIMQTHGNSDGTSIHPGRALLAEQMGCSIRTITRYLHAILEDNLLIPEQKKGGKFTEIEYHTNNVKLKVRGYVTPETSHEIVTQPQETAPLDTFIPEQAPEQLNGNHVSPAPVVVARYVDPHIDEKIANCKSMIARREAKLASGERFPNDETNLEEFKRRLEELESEKQNVSTGN